MKKTALEWADSIVCEDADCPNDIHYESAVRLVEAVRAELRAELLKEFDHMVFLAEQECTHPITIRAWRRAADIVRNHGAEK